MKEHSIIIILSIKQFLSFKTIILMTIFRRFFFAGIVLFTSVNGVSQNVMINVLTKNNGEVKKGETIFFEVTIYNTSATKSLAAYKIRPQISFPSTLITIPESGHVLPKGWAVTSNKQGVIVLSNGTDIIAENTNRTVLIAMKATGIGGPSPIIGNLFFSTGKAPGLANGAAPKEDNGADNSSTSTIRVL